MKLYFNKLNRLSILFLCFIAVVLCYLLFSFINLFNTNIRKFKANTRRGERIRYEITDALIGLSENKLPLCVGNLLDSQDYHYAKEARGSFDNSRLISKTGSCRLIHYTPKNAVACLDVLNNGSANKALYFAFLGDSRIRQQFYNFVRLLPDYDIKSQPSPIPFNYHGDIEVTSDILRLRVSFKWRPFINDNVTKTIRQWSLSKPTDERPYFIFLSMTLHHLAQIHSVDDFQLFRKKFNELGTIIDQLASYSKVIWLNQYPTIEFTVSEKIHYFNKAIRRLMLHYLHNHASDNIRIWDSSNILAEEYVRSCVVLLRDQSLESFLPIVEYANSFINCNDNVHTGNSALSQATQLLYNDLCNIHRLQ